MNRDVGSPLWLASIWSGGPVRDLTKVHNYTQRQTMQIAGEDLWTQGLEGMALWLLDYLMIIGVIDKVKPQPCHWLPPRARAEQIPDFLVRLRRTQECGILQVKSHRYLTAEVQEDFRSEAEFAASKGLFHLLWTDRFPLTSGVKQNIARLRRARSAETPEEEYAAFLEFLRVRVRVSALEIACAGHEPCLIDIATRRGHAFFDVTEKINEYTTVSIEPVFDPERFFMSSGYDGDALWNSLPSPQGS